MQNFIHRYKNCIYHLEFISIITLEEFNNKLRLIKLLQQLEIIYAKYSQNSSKKMKIII